MRKTAALIVVWCLISFSCAKVVELSGGDKDTRPPRLLKSIPDTFAVGFKNSSIILYFDEFINLNNPSSEIFFSPPYKNIPDFVNKGKSLLIKLKDTLLENTTYTINLGKAVSDITESNIAENLSYVFSTGNSIDSGKISGFVTDALTGDPVKGVKVMAYADYADSVPYRKKPLYYTTTNEAGSFTMNYLRPGYYRLFILLEENNSFTYDRPGEMIGFADTLVSTADSIPAFYHLFAEELEKVSLLKAKSYKPGKVLFEFSGGNERIEILNVTPSDIFSDSLIEKNMKGDSLIWWFRPTSADSVQFIISMPGKTDTVSVQLSQVNLNSTSEKSVSGRKKQTDAFSVKIDVKKDTPQDVFKPIRLIFSHPVDSIFASKILLISTKDTISPQVVFTDKAKKKAKLNTLLKGRETYTLVLQKGAFASIYRQFTDSSSVTFKTRAESDYASLEIKLKNMPGKGTGIVQILKEKEVISELPVSTSNPVAIFRKLEPATYTLRYIDDRNKNRKWDTGKYASKIQPEKVIYMAAAITIRESWDQVIEWDFTPDSAKSKKGR